MFKLEFDTTNDVFDENGKQEIRRILNRIYNDVYFGRHEGIIHDINGNQIGYWISNNEER